MLGMSMHRYYYHKDTTLPLIVKVAHSNISLDCLLL